MKKTIQEIRNKLFSKEVLSEHDLLRLRGGDGEDDKRKDVGGAYGPNFGGNGNFNNTSPSGTNTGGSTGGGTGGDSTGGGG
jgi:hypothetical protein